MRNPKETIGNAKEVCGMFDELLDAMKDVDTDLRSLGVCEVCGHFFDTRDPRGHSDEASDDPEFCPACIYEQTNGQGKQSV